MNSPSVSILMTSYNPKESYIKRAVDSVLSQTYSDWELIIVDNSSVDDTENLVDGYNNPKIKITSVDNDGVIGISRNEGIQKANGDLIAFLDSDDWWNSIKLESILNNFDDKIDIIYHDCFIVTDSSINLLQLN